MWSEENGPFIAGLIFGAVLLLIGAVAGYVAGRRHGDVNDLGIDRQRMLKMLREIGAWTAEYRGGVTKYQDQLAEISRDAKEASGEVGTDQALRLVEQIMQSNRELQSRLELAEQQLEQQTHQIESYLSEARTDALTGLANRRAFDKKLDELFASYRRDGNTFVIALIDIDHFKQINDTHGHPAGDEVLQTLAQRIRRGVEGAFLVARFGGEEFAILLPSPLNVATAKIDAFRKAFARESIPCDDMELKVTFSIGISEAAADTMIGPIIRRADEALYAAKGMGRNRTYYHDGKAPVLFGAPEVAGNTKL